MNIKNINKTKKIIKIVSIMSIFLALSILLSFLEFPIPIPLWPPYLEFDFSIIIVVLTLYLFGIEYAILLSLLKNIFKALLDSSIGFWIGPLLNFLLAIIFLLSICLWSYIFKKITLNLIIKTIIIFILSTIIVAFFAVVFNYGFILKLYGIDPNNIGFHKVFIIYFSFTVFKFFINSIIIIILLIGLSKIINNFYQYLISIRSKWFHKINPSFFK